MLTTPRWSMQRQVTKFREWLEFTLPVALCSYFCILQQPFYHMELKLTFNLRTITPALKLSITQGMGLESQIRTQEHSEPSKFPAALSGKVVNIVVSDFWRAICLKKTPTLMSRLNPTQTPLISNFSEKWIQCFAEGKQSSLFQGNISTYISLCNKISPQDHTEGIAYCFKANVLSKTPLFLNFIKTSLLHSSVLLMHDVWRLQLPPDFCKHHASFQD